MSCCKSLPPTEPSAVGRPVGVAWRLRCSKDSRRSVRLSFDNLTFGCRPDRLAASPARRQGQPDNQDSTCRTFASVEAALGLIAVVAVAITRTWTPTIDPAVLLAAPAIGTITGALAGITPAIKAAHTHPPTPSADKGVQH